MSSPVYGPVLLLLLVACKGSDGTQPDPEMGVEPPLPLTPEQIEQAEQAQQAQQAATDAVTKVYLLRSQDGQVYAVDASDKNIKETLSSKGIRTKEQNGGDTIPVFAEDIITYYERGLLNYATDFAIRNDGDGQIWVVFDGAASGGKGVSGEGITNLFLAAARANTYVAGGGGADNILSYAYAPTGVRLDLSLTTQVDPRGSVSGSWAHGDSITNINHIVGSDYNDVLTGNGKDNIIHGGTGADVLTGGYGADRLYGDGGTDTASYASSSFGVTIDLFHNDKNTGGDATGDTLESIENLIGSPHADSLAGTDKPNVFLGGAGADEIRGRDGLDTASYAGSAAGVVVDLSDDIKESGGDANGDRLISIENLIGSAFGDELTGDSKNNVIEGGARIISGEGDVIDGGGGEDTASYASSPESVVVDLSDNRNNTGGDAVDDRLISIENLIGSQHDDKLTGDAAANRLDGGAGDDTLEGEDGNDRLYGGVGDDTLEGGGGRDVIHGGRGTDTASYAGSSGLVSVDLSDNSANAGGHVAGDRLISIENLIGSAYNDQLTGDENANHLDGGAGADELSGGEGNDTLIGGAGADELTGGEGNDTASYVESSEGVTVDLSGRIANAGGDAEGTDASGNIVRDILVSVENLIGSTHDDNLVGDENANRLQGGAGDDELRGRNGDDTVIGGAGADVLIGGGGNDTASYVESSEAVTIDLSGVTANAGGDAEGTDAEGETVRDRLVDIENLIGSAHDDKLTGDEHANRLEGGAGHDELVGGDGNDTLVGGDGNDTLFGGNGVDMLTGNSGDDTFVLKIIESSDSVALASKILDFSGGDKLDVSGTYQGGDVGLTHVWFDNIGVDADGDGTDDDTVVYAGNAGNTAVDTSKVLAVLVNYTTDLAVDDFIDTLTVAEIV